MDNLEILESVRNLFKRALANETFLKIKLKINKFKKNTTFLLKMRKVASACPLNQTRLRSVMYMCLTKVRIFAFHSTKSKTIFIQKSFRSFYLLPKFSQKQPPVTRGFANFQENLCSKKYANNCFCSIQKKCLNDIKNSYHGYNSSCISVPTLCSWFSFRFFLWHGLI